MHGRLRKLALLGTLALSLTGCTTLTEYIHNGFKVGPNYHRPPAPVAEHWIDADDVRVHSEIGDDSHWWTVFGDPVLDGLIGQAYQQNLTLREAGFRILEARAQLGIARGELFPQTQVANGGYTRTAASGAVANRQAVIERFYSQWDLGFGLAWELDFWGRFRRAIEASADELDASVDNYDDVLVTLLADVASAYVQMRIIEQQLVFVKANIVLQRESLGIAVARFKGGQATELDPAQAQSLLSQTEALVPQLEIQLRVFNNQLCTLLGVPPEELHAKIGSAPIPTAPIAVAAGIPGDLLRRRPDVRKAERQAAAQSARIGIAESDFYPSVSITGTIGYSAEEIPNLFTPEAFRGTIGPNFSWNILNYGRILNSVRVQDARFQEAVSSYQNTVLQAQQDVENGLVRFLQSQQKAKYYAESVDAATKAVAVAVTQYKGGLIDFNRVSTLEQNLVDQQNSLAQSRGEIGLGLIQVYKAIGGGWQIRCPANEVPAAPPLPTATVPPPVEAIDKPPLVLPEKK